MMKWANLDERQKNVAKSFGVAFLSLIVLTLALAYIIYPYQEAEIERLKQQCDNPDECNITVGQSPLIILMALPALIIYTVTLRYLEKKRIRNWRSWK